MNWDITSKLLLKECPQDFVTYVVPGARFVRMRETQFQTRGDSPYKSREMRSDALIEAEYEGEHFLIHIEWQSDSDDEMDIRLLGYCYEAMRLHKLPVLSIVIYLKPVGNVPQPPFKRDLLCGFSSIWFNYKSVEMAARLADEIRQHNLDGLRPMMLLCKDGATYEVLEEVLEYLTDKKKGNLVALTRCFAGMVFTSEKDVEWLKRRFEMLDEFLWQNSWTYRDMIEQGMERGRARGLEQGLEQGLTQGLAQGMEQGRVQGLEQGREQGREQGLEQGRIQQICQNIELIVQTRFPALLVQTRRRVERLNDLATLQNLLLTAATATEEETERALR